MTVVTQFPSSNALDGTNVNWTNAANAYADDDVDATGNVIACMTELGTRWGTYGFDALVPAGSVITKVQIIYEATGGVSNNMDVAAYVGGVQQTIHDNPDLTGTRTVFTYDITADRAWTRADILDGTLAVVVRSVSNFNGSYTLDYVKVEVTFDTPVAQDWANWADSAQPLPGLSIQAPPWTQLP